MNNLSVVTLISVLSISLAFAGGAAFNGPDLSGSSVPVTVDRAISKSDLMNAISQCSLAAATDLGQQIFHHTVKGCSFQRDARVDVTSGDYILNIEIDYVTGYDPASPTQDSRRDDSGAEVYFTSLSFAAHGLAFTGLGAGNSVTQFTTVMGPSGSAAILPVFTYDAEIPDSAYDELGRLDNSRVVLKNLKLVYPKNFGPAVPLINLDTQHVTSVLMNEEKLADCFLAKLQGN